jgi:hypothetical protein
MSDLVEDLKALLDERTEMPHQKRCYVGLILEQVTGEQREWLEVLLEEDCRVPSGKVADTLRKWGYDISYHSVQRHRRRARGAGCLCP